MELTLDERILISQLISTAIKLPLYGDCRAQLNRIQEAYDAKDWDDLFRTARGSRHGIYAKLQVPDIFKNILDNGLGYKYTSNSTLAFVTTYKNGKRHGESLCYYPDGTLYSTCTYVDDELQGKRFSYHPDGTIESMLSYGDDKLHGESVWYHQDGTLKSRCVYLNGVEQK